MLLAPGSGIQEQDSSLRTPNKHPADTKNMAFLALMNGEVVNLINKHRQRFIRGTVFNFKNLAHGKALKSIGPHAINSVGGKSHHFPLAQQAAG